MSKQLEFTELEQVYECLAEAIDTVGKEQEALLLAKLCMLLANQVADLERVKEAIATAQQNLSS